MEFWNLSKARVVSWLVGWLVGWLVTIHYKNHSRSGKMWQK